MATYQKPGALTTRLVNPLIATLTKLGLSVRGAHVGHERLHLGDQVLIQHVQNPDRSPLGSETLHGTLQRQARTRPNIRRH